MGQVRIIRRLALAKARRERGGLPPLRLPIDLLIACERSLPTTLRGLEDVWKYFRLRVEEGIGSANLRKLLRREAFDILQWEVSGRWHRDGSGAMAAHGTGKEISSQWLSEVLHEGRVRLLILVCEGASYEPLVDLARRQHDGGGPPILVVSGNAARRNLFLAGFYYGIIHDQPLSVAFSAAPTGVSGVESFLACSGAADTALRLSPLLEPLRAEAKARAKHAKRMVQDLEVLGSRLGARQKSMLSFDEPHGRRGVEPRVALARKIESLDRIGDLIANYLHETGAMVPMRETFEAIDATKALVDSLEAAIGRVVNTWFSLASRPLAPEESLAADTEYAFHLQIGPPLPQSNVGRPAALPEKELKRFQTPEGLELRVILFSEDFKIPAPAQLLRLPPAPLATQIATFSLRAPSPRPGARLRVGVYFRQNLLQSVIVTAAITQRPSQRHRVGNRGIVDFALAGALREPELFPERQLNILTNEAEDGTHTFAVVGTSLQRAFTLKEGPMSKAVGRARKTLEGICAEGGVQNGKPGRYRFDGDNRGKRKDFLADLPALAYLGYKLYTGQVTRQDRRFASSLREALGTRATIQIAVADSAEYVFPWALVYDKPLEHNDGKNVLCPAFVAALDAGGDPGFLEHQVCLFSGCPHAADTNVICPSGFWGFRNIIEQPLSDIGPAGQSGSLEIKARGKIALLMAISENLATVVAHEAEVRALAKFEVEVRAAKAEIGTGLARKDLQLAYFYCHGGRQNEDLWLGVGKKERIYDTDLDTWQLDWSVPRTLVFLNGCHTVDFSPDDLLSFNRVLAGSHASGVIGTEIAVPEVLARHVAKGFLVGLADGESVGDIIRRQRLLLLERFNPLGLVYTPYCHAGLRVTLQ